MSDAQRLYDLLGRLGARPNELKWHIAYGLYRDEGESLHPDDALAILRDAARRVCDDEMVEISWDVISERKITHWCVEYRPCNEYDLIAENCESYESALIAGLEWIAEQPK
ncbi:MAG TPA: hypothetical protein VIG24_08145 [Acidimicrobiia bacterium]